MRNRYMIRVFQGPKKLAEFEQTMDPEHVERRTRELQGRFGTTDVSFELLDSDAVEGIKVGPYEVCKVGFGSKAWMIRGADLRGGIMQPSKAAAIEEAKRLHTGGRRG
ncbi:MAG TPA: hypothetical protein VFA39_15760 [Steroidobacteraceae bacterium]|nr:hypothetical protein [Steroidobacteraceae bacterium]